MQSASNKLFFLVLIFVTVPVAIGLVCATDVWAPPYQYKGVIYPAAFQDGEVSYIIPGTGGGVGMCKIEPEVASLYSVGSNILIRESVIFGRCEISELPQGWEQPNYY
jgi:hypothetical protein